MNQQGQEFAVFKILIGAILALAILIIVIGVINYFENLKTQISEKRLSDALVSAANAPGQIIVAEKLSFKKETSYSFSNIANKINIPVECLSPDSVPASFDVSLSSQRITVLHDLQANVYFKCLSQTDIDFPSSCSRDLACIVSFGKPIPN